MNLGQRDKLLPGYGGGTDYIWMADVRTENLQLVQDGEDLYVTDVADWAEGRVDAGVAVEDFFYGGDNVIEYLFGADGMSGYDLTELIA